MRILAARPSLPILFLSVSALMAALVTVGEPSRASASDLKPVLLVPSAGVGEEMARSSPKVLAAIQRDLRLTRAEAITRIGRQHAAGAVEARARHVAGRHFAGSWLNDDGSTPPSHRSVHGSDPCPLGPLTCAPPEFCTVAGAAGRCGDRSPWRLCAGRRSALG
jgi:hypothetical protein